MRISDWSSYVCSSDLDGSGGSVQLSASVDVAVDLADAAARGIHMSRLYLRLQEAFATENVTPGGLRRVLQEFIDSQNGLSTAARLVLRYDHLLQRAALSSGHLGWKAYPVTIEATLQRSEKRRVGKERVSACELRWSAYHSK